jgi:RNA polymerase sigma-70 factor (sigma-E family)
MGFEEFLDRHLQQLARLATVLCGDRSAGEDVLQEVLLRAHQLWPRIAAADSSVAYVRTMLVHEHLTLRRKRDRQVLYAEVETGQRTPDPAVRVTELAELRDRLDTLAPQQRAAVVLRFFADLPDAEIGDALGCSAVTVRSYISRALSTMRVAMTRELADHSSSRKDQ